jgi:hypothetical protein
MVIGPTIYPDGKSATEITQEAEEWIESEAGKLPIPNFVTGP